MALAGTSVDVPPPFGPACVKRGLRIHYWVEGAPATKGAVYAAKDISASRWTYRVRTWDSDDDTDPIIDEAITKGSASSTGELDHYVALGTTVREACIFEIVEVDNDNADASTRTGKREYVLQRWIQPVVDVP